ncbi:MAG: homocysteine S-methyltransferase family protein [Bacteroidales bacterium]|nr:homocysteine S-methyltransferase family protein [Bacteroidales bacterium]
MMSTIEDLFENSKIILTEGAYVERLKSEFNLKLDEHLNHAGLIYTHPDLLESLYRQYLDIGQKYSLPMMVMTPTRKVNAESLKKSIYGHKNVLEDSCRFLDSIRGTYGEYASKIMIGGLMGCKSDAYNSSDALGKEESYHFHKIQADRLAKENIDFLFAGIMPEINEIIGMARAMAETNLPYIISFMIRKDGCLIDGTSICDAIKIIDQAVDPAPTCYMTNCVHPANLRLALSHPKNINRPELKRFKGIQANSSALSPEELNNCTVLHCGDFEEMIDEMIDLYQHFDLKIFGGCCGTNDQFIEKLSAQLSRL